MKNAFASFKVYLQSAKKENEFLWVRGETEV